MFNFYNYNLIKQSEDMKLFNFQQQIIMNKDISEEEKILKISILLAENPIGDYETAIKILYEYSQENTASYKVLILGTYMSAMWPFIEPSVFLEKLRKRYDELPLEMKVIIKYLEAYALGSPFVKGKKKKEQCINLLKESIFLYDGYFSTYHGLAILLPKRERKKIMEIALSKVTKVYDEKEYEDLNQSVDYEFYFNKYIAQNFHSKERYEEVGKIG